jgi:hypothetical protein
MSLINDALKRAKKAQQTQPPLPPAGAPPLPPVESESRGGLGWLLLIILLVAVGCFFIGLAFSTHKPPVDTKPLIAQTQVALAPAVPVPPKPDPPPQTNVVAVAPPRPAPPPLQLQGILLGSGTPQAIVNGQTVYAGDSVNGFRVQFISKNNVLFVASDGTEKTLMLGK